MILPRSFIRLSLVCLQLLTVLMIAPGELPAVQIEPNPNPDGNTITITSATPRENLVPFTNAGIINIQPVASLSNATRFENAGGIFTAGTITNADVFINNRVFTLQEGSRFNNLASGLYSGFQGSVGINGSFINEGAVTHSLGHIIVGERGEYIQRQSLGSSVTPTTITPDAPFTNAGRVHIAAGDFIIDPVSLRAASATYDQSSTGTTQIDARFQNIGGEVRNAGAFTVGSTGEYRQQSPIPGFLAGSTTNSGTFTNAGTTNIATGTFTNQGSVVNAGTFGVAAAGQVSGTGSYVQTTSAAHTIVNGTFAHNISLQAGSLSGTGTIQGTVQNSGGLLLPGNNGLGTLTIKGQYAQGFGGTFGVNLAGLSQGVTYGLLAVKGTGAAVTLGGSLKVGLLNGFSPSLGSTFGVLTCTGCTISGGLRSLSLPTLASGLDWSVRFVDGLGTLQLAVVSTPIPGSGAPEPGTLLLVGAGFVGLVGWRRRQARSVRVSRP